MSMETWARREVELTTNKGGEDCLYYDECCKSALKAFESLCKDGHSGMSIHLTKHILNKLIDGNPLSPIEDIPEVWSEVIDRQDDHVSYQCVRKSSLFKNVYTDGTITYSDVDRVTCYYNGDKNNTWSNGGVTKIINEMFPIKLPYEFTGRYIVACEEFLVNPKNGDYDTIGILHVTTPDGEQIEINKFMHEVKGQMIDIPKNVYDRLKRVSEQRIKNEQK